MIEVAIFTTDEFDASTVDSSTVQFSGASATSLTLEDIDGDGDQDLLLSFRVRDTNLLEAHETLILADLDDGQLDSNKHTYEAVLSGETTDGVSIKGSDLLDLFLSGKALRDFLAALP